MINFVSQRLNDSINIFIRHHCANCVACTRIVFIYGLSQGFSSSRVVSNIEHKLNTVNLNRSCGVDFTHVWSNFQPDTTIASDFGNIVQSSAKLAELNSYLTESSWTIRSAMSMFQYFRHVFFIPMGKPCSEMSNTWPPRRLNHVARPP